MKKIVGWVLAVVFIVTAVFGAFSMKSYISLQDTLRGMRWAIENTHGSFIYGKDELLIFFSPWRTGYVMTVITRGGDPVRDLTTLGPGVKDTLMSTADRIEYLESQGWTRVYKEDLPTNLINMISSFSIYLFSIGAGTLPELFMIPAVNLQLPDFQPPVYQQ